MNSILYTLCAGQNWALGKVAAIEERLPHWKFKRHESPTSTDGDISNGYQVGVCTTFFIKHHPTIFVVHLSEVYISVETIYYITPVGPGGKLGNCDHRNTYIYTNALAYVV